MLGSPEHFLHLLFLNTKQWLSSVAMMSRPVAGVRNRTVIVTLPGSPKGAKENLRAIIKLLPHACLQAAGADSRSLHAGGIRNLEQEAGLESPKQQPLSTHHHHHDHDHSHPHAHQNPSTDTQPFPEIHPQSKDSPVFLTNDPAAGPTMRLRQSPYPMVSIEEALTTVSRYSRELKVFEATIDENILGCTLAEDVLALEPIPSYRASRVDGYALHISPTSPYRSGTYDVTSVSNAGAASNQPLETGQVARISTGAPLPPNTTAVIMIEQTELDRSTADGSEELTVQLKANQLQSGDNVRQVGSDIAPNATVFTKNMTISAARGDIGLLASIGRTTVRIYQKPVVGVLSTGDELVPFDQPGPPRPGQVRDSNRPNLVSLIRSWGYKVLDLGIAPDTPADLETTLPKYLPLITHLVTSGGVSMGERDFVKPVLERALHARIHFGRVNIKPGKPITFATIPYGDGDGDFKLFFGLPGNPVSALVTAHLFLQPSLTLSHTPLPPPPPPLTTAAAASGSDARRCLRTVRVLLEEGVLYDGQRLELVRAVVRMRGGRAYGVATGVDQGSSRLLSFRAANAVLWLGGGGGEVVDLGEGGRLREGRGCGCGHGNGRRVFAKGTEVEAVMFGDMYYEQ